MIRTISTSRTRRSSPVPPRRSCPFRRSTTASSVTALRGRSRSCCRRPTTPRCEGSCPTTKRGSLACKGDPARCGYPRIVTQPTFVPVADSGAVRRCAPTATAEIGRPKKPGLLGAPHSVSGSGHGTPGPDAGYALTLAHSIVHDLTLAPNESAHDVEVAMALLASKRAGLVGRGPTKTDVKVALDLFRFRGRADATEAADRLDASRNRPQLRRATLLRGRGSRRSPPTTTRDGDPARALGRAADATLGRETS